MPNSFLRFLNFAHAVKETTPEWPALDPTEERLLFRFAGTWFNKGPITIADAVELIHECSPGTAHTKITSLIKKGVLEAKLDDKDRRVKKLVPTKLTLDYFNKLDAGII